MFKYIIPASVLVIIAIAAIGFYLSTNKNSPTNNAISSQTQTPTPSEAAPTHTTSTYKNGTYTATGNYVSPGGPRDIGLTITVKDDVITDAIFEGRATDATSKKFQGEFGDNFKPMVVGKSITGVVLTKVSGSSLTPKGFNEALEKIKQQAKPV